LKEEAKVESVEKKEGKIPVTSHFTSKKLHTSPRFIEIARRKKRSIISGMGPRGQAAVETLRFAGTFTAVFLFLFKDKLLATSTDRTFEKIVQNTANISIYTQHVETNTIESGIKMNIIGDYDMNKELNSFQSVATTTLILPESEKNAEHSFNITNISINDDVYTKVETDSDFIKGRMPDSNVWLQFKAASIPNNLSNISIPGPVIDNLKLFAENGRYLKILDDHKNDASVNEDELHYTLGLSVDAFKKDGLEVLGVTVKRIGEYGFIEIWADKDTFILKKIVLKNDPYESTTTIYNVNNTIDISPPVL